MKKILIIEDEPDMIKGLRDNLEFEDYQVDSAMDGNEGLDKALNNYYDLILLDIMLPGISGFDICRSIRDKGVDTPVIIISARSEEIDKVLGLEMGADDYIIKPFGLRELLARIRANLRRSATSSQVESAYIKIGKLSVNFKNYQAFNTEGQVKMSHKEFELLQYLYENPCRIINRDELMDNVWDINNEITSRTVDNFIVRLRQKTETDPGNPRIILTVHGAGYKMIYPPLGGS